MKKLLLIAMALSIGALAYSQQTKPLGNQRKDLQVHQLTRQADIKDEISRNNVFDQTVRSANVAPQETHIGSTRYDLQTNTMLNGRIYQHPDGTIGAVWTQGVIQANTFADRGTGYNYFDGAEWGSVPTARIESVRTGWPNYAPWGTNGEIVIAHNGSTGLQVTKRANKGTGAWEESLYQGPAPIQNNPTWPRMATGGENNETIHLIYNSYVAYNDQTTALLYSRSSDGGATWDPKDITFDEFGPDKYSQVGADSYAIAARGNTVAILIADTWNTDLALLKSVDNGDTWENTIIWEHPYPFYDWDVTVTDTFSAVDGSASLAIGPDGKVHVVFGICRVLHDVPGNNYWIINLLDNNGDGIGYWNEDMPVFGNGVDALCPPQWGYEGSEMVEDYNYIGWLQDIDGNGNIDLLDANETYRTIGNCTMPDITVDENNNIFIVYSGLCENFDNATNNFRHIWGRAFANNTWGPFVDLDLDLVHFFDECIYPVLSPTSDDNIHLLYQADGFPGLAIDSTHLWTTNFMYYSAVPKEDLLTGIRPDNKLINEQSVSQNYPNPFSETSVISVNLKESADLSMTLSNILGQEAMKIERGTVSAGTYFFEIDGTILPKGVYFYTVKADDSAVTKKMIVQ